MRREARNILDQFVLGLPYDQVVGNKKTKSKMHRLFLYGELIRMLIDEVQLSEYTLSIPTLRKLLKEKNEGIYNR